MSNFKKAKKIVLIILIAPLLIALFGYVVMLLWNWLIPDLFNGPVIDFWQTLGLLLLSKILFGGFKGGGGYKRKGRHQKGWWNDMTPEEKQALKERWAKKWSCDYREGNSDTSRTGQ